MRQGQDSTVLDLFNFHLTYEGGKPELVKNVGPDNQSLEGPEGPHEVVVCKLSFEGREISFT